MTRMTGATPTTTAHPPTVGGPNPAPRASTTRRVGLALSAFGARGLPAALPAALLLPAALPGPPPLAAQPAPGVAVPDQAEAPARVAGGVAAPGLTRLATLHTVASATDTIDATAEKGVTLVLGAEGAAEARAQGEDFLSIGGAVRYNFLVENYESGTSTNSAQFTWDMWRINVQGRSNQVGIQFEYRFYPTFNTHFIKEGWLEYDTSDRTQIQVGVTQTPFGNLQYNSHNWWFQLPYYVGLEDDHDTGVKLLHERGPWNLQFAYFLQPEPAGPAYGEASFGIGGAGRYSYDMIPVPDRNQSNQEKHQANIRAVRTLEHEGGGTTEFGASAQIGGIYNMVTEGWGTRGAGAIHLDGTYGSWNVLAQHLRYAFDATDDDGVAVDEIFVAAYGDPYAAAAEASMTSLGIQFTKEIEVGPFTQLNLYENYTWMRKSAPGFADTHQNVLGASLAAGALFVYFDLATGKNHPWLTESFGSGLAAGDADARWNTRFNVNIGYYF